MYLMAFLGVLALALIVVVFIVISRIEQNNVFKNYIKNKSNVDASMHQQFHQYDVWQ